MDKDTVDIYLADGAYARWDGLSIVIYCDRSGVEHYISLEPEAIELLVKFANVHYGRKGQ